jgi:hypothetical protein
VLNNESQLPPLPLCLVKRLIIFQFVVFTRIGMISGVQGRPVLPATVSAQWSFAADTPTNKEFDDPRGAREMNRRKMRQDQKREKQDGNAREKYRHLTQITQGK